MPSRSDFFFFFKYVSNCFFTVWSLPFDDSHFYLVSFQHRPCPPSQYYNPPRSHPLCRVTQGEIVNDENPFYQRPLQMSCFRGCCFQRATKTTGTAVRRHKKRGAILPLIHSNRGLPVVYYLDKPRCIFTEMATDSDPQHCCCARRLSPVPASRSAKMFFKIKRQKA